MDLHGLSKTRLYKIWEGMVERTTNCNAASYKNYGGRGVSICNEWLHFRNFAIWALSNGYTTELTIERVDNDGDYHPNNCKWVTMAEQAYNKRVRSDSSSGFTGVSLDKHSNRWFAYVYMKTNGVSKRKSVGYFKDLIEAVEARNQFILDNNLPYKTQDA